MLLSGPLEPFFNHKSSLSYDNFQNHTFPFIIIAEYKLFHIFDNLYCSLWCISKTTFVEWVIAQILLSRTPGIWVGERYLSRDNYSNQFFVYVACFVWLYRSLYELKHFDRLGHITKDSFVGEVIAECYFRGHQSLSIIKIVYHEIII